MEAVKFWTRSGKTFLQKELFSNAEGTIVFMDESQVMEWATLLGSYSKMLGKLTHLRHENQRCAKGVSLADRGKDEKPSRFCVPNLT